MEKNFAWHQLLIVMGMQVQLLMPGFKMFYDVELSLIS
jgi:hypothetical protein